MKIYTATIFLYLPLITLGMQNKQNIITWQPSKLFNNKVAAIKNYSQNEEWINTYIKFREKQIDLKKCKKDIQECKQALVPAKSPVLSADTNIPNTPDIPVKELSFHLLDNGPQVTKAIKYLKEFYHIQNTQKLKNFFIINIKKIENSDLCKNAPFIENEMIFKYFDHTETPFNLPGAIYIEGKSIIAVHVCTDNNKNDGDILFKLDEQKFCIKAQK